MALRIVSAAGSLTDVLLGVLLLSAVGVTLVSIVTSYFNASLPWVLDVSLLLFIWLIQVGALRTAHIRVNFIFDMFPDAIRRILSLASAIISVWTLVVLTYGAIVSYDFFAADHYVSLPWLSENVRFIPLFVVGPAWIAIIVATEFGWLPPRGGDDNSDERGPHPEGAT